MIFSFHLKVVQSKSIFWLGFKKPAKCLQTYKDAGHEVKATQRTIQDKHQTAKLQRFLRILNTTASTCLFCKNVRHVPYSSSALCSLSDSVTQAAVCISKGIFNDGCSLSGLDKNYKHGPTVLFVIAAAIRYVYCTSQSNAPPPVKLHFPLLMSKCSLTWMYSCVTAVSFKAIA